MIIQTVCFDDFCNSFSESYKNNFSNSGKKALFDYLENLSEDLGEDIELDPVCLCCDYTEYNNAYDAMKEYQPEDMPLMGEEGDDLVEIAIKEEAEAKRWLEEKTEVIECDNGHVIIANF